MIKTAIATALIAFAFTAPAFADEMMKCDDATMKMMHDDMDKGAMTKMTDKMKEGMEMAKKEMAMASDSMKANKMEDCSKHLGMAKTDMMMK